MRRLLRNSYLLSVFVFFTTSLKAQPIERFIDRITEEDGLSHPSVYDVVQDHDGFLWIGTEDGLNRYDGYEFVSYFHDPEDSTTLSSSSIHMLDIDHNGNIWMGTVRGGVNRLNPRTGEITRFMHDPKDSTSLSNDATGVVIVDREGTVWIGTPHGLNRFDPSTESFKRYYHDPDDEGSISNDFITSFHVDAQDNLWIGTGFTFSRADYPGEGGLNRWNKDTDSFTRYVHNPNDTLSLFDNVIWAIHEDHKGTLWAAGRGSSLQYLDPAKDRFIRWYPSKETEQLLTQQEFLETDGGNPFGFTITDIVEDLHGDLWMGTFFNGLVQFDDSRKTLRSYKNKKYDPRSLGDNRVIFMYKDRQDIVWAATMNGLSKIHPYAGSFKSITTEDIGVGNGLVNSLLADSDGHVWLSANNQLAKHDPSTNTTQSYDLASVSPIKNAQGSLPIIYKDSQGTIWYVSGKGLFTKASNETAFKSYLLDTSHLYSLNVFAIVEDTSGRLWFGTSAGAVYKEPDSEELIFIQPRYPGNSHVDSTETVLVYDIIQDVSDPSIYWFASPNGLFQYDSRSSKLDFFLDGIDIMDLYDDGNGRIWAASYNTGLYAFEKAAMTVVQYNTDNGLSTERTTAVLGDKRGRIWVSTMNALSMVDPENNTVQNYGSSSGMYTSRFNYKSAFKSEEGLMYFGGDNGYLIFNPNTFDINPHPPEVVSTEVRVNDRVLVNAEKAEFNLGLKHDENDIFIAFAGIHLDRPQENQYMYKLEGYDDQWKGPTAIRSVNFTNLSPGGYAVKVKASNADGVWSEEKSLVQMTIAPPWWRTMWAYSLFALAGIGLMYSANRMQRARQIRESENRSRIREAQMKAKHAEAQHKLLADLDLVKSRFFANISHEFRTPLTLLLGPIRDALEGQYDPDEKRWHQQLGMMERNASKLLQLINQLLDLSRLESGQMVLSLQQKDMVSFVRRVAMSFSSLAERKAIQFKKSFPQEPAYLYFDVDKMEIVVSNLLSNAFKFTENQGKIFVEVALTSIHAIITVKDTGKGIPEDDLAHVFDRFYQADNSATRRHEGTGIGLSLSKELVELHGGSIHVESTVGFGSTFKVQIPRTLMPQSPESDSIVVDQETHFDEESWYEGSNVELAKDYELSTSDSGAPLILVVEDNDDVRAYLRLNLGAHYHVEEARDGMEGLEKMQEKAPDLVISDVMMPRMGGFEFCERIKADKKFNHIPVLLLTARSAEADKLEGLKSGADDYLMKPFNTRELMVRVENLITIRGTLKEKFVGTVLVGPEEIEVPAAEAVFLDNVRRVVEENMHNDSFTVEYLAGEVALSPRQLQRRLRASTNLSASGYIRSMRLKKAAQLLGQEWGNVSEVAHAVGFRSVPHFSRLFKQVYGVLPSQYLESLDE